MADNSPAIETEEQSLPPREFNSVDLLQLMSQGRSLTAQEIKELKARIKVREEMAELVDRMHALEEHEQSRIPEQPRIPEQSQRLRKRRQRIHSDPSSDNELSYPEPDSSSSDSDHNSSS
ncbi:hypothetical protein BDV12DRAFT_111783 [Aspergillus spectabilis]